MRRKIVALIATLGVAAAGCNAEEPRSAGLSKEIETFQFGDTEWYDTVVDTTVTLKGGLARRDTEGPEFPGGLDWRMLGPPAYTDIDADGDEDAAVGLYSAGGQMVSETWFVWLWDGHTAKQVRHPIAASSRCEGFIESVAAQGGAFSVRSSIMEKGDACASGGRTPVTYEVGLRDGWPVRTSPDYGPLETCNIHEQTKRVTPARDLQLRVAADDTSPPVGTRSRYDAVLVTPSELILGPDGKGNSEWLLVTAERGSEKVCGWTRVADIVGS